MRATEMKRRVFGFVGAGSIAVMVAVAAGGPMAAGATYPRACARIEAGGTSPRACQGILSGEPSNDPTPPPCESATGEVIRRSQNGLPGRIGFILIAN
jgi:hypothetical protein